MNGDNKQRYEVAKMKQVLSVKAKNEVLSLITGISYSCVPAWFGSTVRDLRMDVIAPKVRENHSRCPAILWICGGAYRVVDRSVWLPELLYFARRGYVVASIEYRTTNESGFPAQLVDAKAAVRYLKAHAERFCIDPERICVMGESAGGTIASLLGVTGDIKMYDKGDFLEQSSNVRAVVDFYGPVNFNGDALNTREDIPSWATQDFLGSGYGKEDAEKASAVTYVCSQSPPFLILHGNGDELVPISQSEELYEKLQQQGVTAEYYILDGVGHGADEFYQEEVLEKIIRFLEKNL